MMKCSVIIGGSEHGNCAHLLTKQTWDSDRTSNGVFYNNTYLRNNLVRFLLYSAVFFV